VNTPAASAAAGADMEIIEHHRRKAADSSAATRAGWFERWLQRPGTATAILALSLVVTALAWFAARHYALDEARQRFERRSDDIQARIERRMESYAAMLRAGVALFATSSEVSRSDWRHFTSTLQPAQHYPGIQGVGVARLLQPGDVAALENSVRAEGYPDFKVKPAGERAQYSAIVFLEPLEKRNLRAFGFDMMSEPTRRAAMERARDSGEAALSGVVTLVQEDGKDVQKGLLLYMPVYRDIHGTAITPRTVDERRAALWGWVYAPFRVKDLMHGILGEDTGNIAFQIHDSAAVTATSAFYDSDRALHTGRHDFRRELPLRFGGREWTIVYSGADFESSADTWQSNLVALCGLSIDLLLYWSIARLSLRKRLVEQEVALRDAALDQRRAWLDAVSGLSPDAVLVFDRGPDEERRLVFTNPAFSQLFGLAPEDLLGLTEAAVSEWLSGLLGPAAGLHADPPGGSLPAEQALRAPADPLATEQGMVLLAGPPVKALMRQVRESERQRVYYFRDVTRETEVDRLKSEFLTTAAHELRTPLASVYGFSELLQVETIDPVKRARATRIVHRQAGVLKHLVDELLDLARIDARRGHDFARDRVDLRAVAETAFESVLRPDETPRVLPVLGEQPLWVNGDAAKLQQAVLNLLSNALKYSPEDSIVTLRACAVLHDGRPMAELSVTDRGVGMSAEQQARAFERFYRADPSGHIPGAGLGLSIVKEIVDLHGGEVLLHSRPGQGTELTLRLPLSAAALAATQPTPVPATSEAGAAAPA
jgi:signal transduction histidine kinase